MTVDVRERGSRFAPQVVVTFGDVEADGGQLRVSLGAHEQQHVTPRAPRCLDVLRLRTDRLRTCHHPAQYSHLMP